MLKTSIFGYLNELRTVPPYQMVMAKLSEVINDQDVTIEEIAHVIKSDASLATSVIKLSNAAYYGMSSPAESVDEAVMCLGSMQVYRLVAMIAVNDWMEGGLAAYSFNSRELWEMSLASAIMMEKLARRHEMNYKTAYTIGLMHSVGRCVISKYISEYPGERPTAPRNDYVNLARWELDTIGADFAEITGILLSKWGFAAELYIPIWHQMRPLNAPNRVKMCALLRITVSAAACIAMPNENDESRLEIPEDVMAKVDVDAEELKDVMPLVREELQAMNELVS